MTEYIIYECYLNWTDKNTVLVGRYRNSFWDSSFCLLIAWLDPCITLPLIFRAQCICCFYQCQVCLLCFASLTLYLCCLMPIALSALWRAQGSCFRFIQIQIRNCTYLNKLCSTFIAESWIEGFAWKEKWEQHRKTYKETCPYTLWNMVVVWSLMLFVV